MYIDSVGFSPQTPCMTLELVSRSINPLYSVGRLGRHKNQHLSRCQEGARPRGKVKISKIQM